MKKKLAFLLFLTATMVFAIGVNVTSHASEGSGNSNADALNNVIAKYVDETATYVKETKIFLNDEAITELEINGGFHAGVSTLERTTYYKGSELWMSREDGKYSYYGTAEGNTGVTNATADKPLVTPADAKVVLSGEGKNSMQEYYVGLEDIVAKDAHNWTYADGVYTTTSEEVIEWFKAFTAPCYLGFTTAEVKNYITLDKATISCEGYDLVLKLYASQDGGKLTSEGGVFSQAKILFNVESVFTSEVLENKYILDMPSYDVTIDFYAVKDSNRLYVKADYYVKEPHTTGEWWQQDNFELRLNTPTGFITNGKAYNPSFFGEDKQWYFSSNGMSNFDYFVVSAPVDSAKDGYKVIEFVAYISLDKLGIETDTPLGFSIGSNPGGAGFIGGHGWEKVDLATLKKITTEGILDHCLEDNCAHVFAEYTEIKTETCKEDGLKEGICLYCNHVEQVVIPATGDHVYDLETAEVLTKSTCMDKGIAKVTCGCGYTEEIELDVDLTNHATHWNASTNTCDCGSVVNNVNVDIDYANFHYLDYVVDGSKDFEFDVILNAERKNFEQWGHLFTGEIYSPSWLNGGWSYRADWAGWGQWSALGQASYTDVNTGLWSDKYHLASADMDITLNLKYYAAEGRFVITMTYHSNIAPYSSEDKQLTYTLSGVGYKGEMHVGFGVENAKATFQYVKYTVGESVGPKLDGKLDDAHWTEEVLANSIQFRNNDDAILDLYATRDDFAVHFLAKFQVKELKNTSDNWWEKDNIELRIVANGVNAVSIDTNQQWYVSRTGKWLCDNAYITNPVYNEETGYYEFAFEFYVTNTHLKIDANSPVGLTYSMVTFKGWQGGPNWCSTDMNVINKITKEGIK